MANLVNIKNITYFLQVLVLPLLLPTISYSNDLSYRILDEEYLNSIGYRSTKSYRYSSICGGYEIKSPSDIKYQGIKSINPKKGYDNTYYRFTLIKESYANKTQAQTSLERNHDIKANSWYSKNCGIKRGVQFENVLYYLATDADLFRSQLPIILKKMEVKF